MLGLLFYLYRLSGEIVIYGFALCAALGLIFCAGDFAAFRRRHRALRAALEAMEEVKGNASLESVFLELEGDENA